MKKKYLFVGILLLSLLVSVYFWNIIYAFICHSEDIDKHTFNVMIQGTVKPTKEYNLTINKKLYKIPLPTGSGELNKGEYLIPKSSWGKYKTRLKETEWSNYDEIGTLARVKNNEGDEFDISVRPFTGSYLVLKYSSVNK